MTFPLPGTTPAFVDGIGVLLALGREALPGLNIYETIPDRMAEKLPALTINRAGGASDAPVFHSSYLLHFQVWSGPTTDYPDPHQAAFELSQRVARAYWWAQRNQTVAYDGNDQALGWIAKWRESSGFQRFADPDLPHVGRYVAVYDLLIRNPRS